MPSEVPRGPIDLRAMFGQDVMLVHSSGELVPVNDYGVVYQGLQMGESYYLVTIYIYIHYLTISFSSLIKHVELIICMNFWCLFNWFQVSRTT